VGLMLSAIQVADIHNKVQELKTKYLSLRRQKGDTTNPFETKEKKKA